MSQTQTTTQPILVTGAHRTGTTWVGKMLAAGGGAAYISEPLNILHRPGVLRVPTQHWYTYLCPQNEAAYLPALREMLALRYHTWAEVRSLRSVKDLLRMGRDWGIFQRGRLLHQRPLLKDPFAVFSAPWFAERLDCQVVVTVRHPAAFASSLKRLGWPFQFADLLDQPLLMDAHLSAYKDDMLAASQEDPITQASLLWKIIYKGVGEYCRSHPDFLLVRHEDLSLSPLDGFRRLYTDLGLTYNRKAQRAIESSSSADNPEEISRKSAHSVKVDSQANLQRWKQRLTPQEIDCVRRISGDVAARTYPDESWD